jgi:hypothetical protein
MIDGVYREDGGRRIYLCKSMVHSWEGCIAMHKLNTRFTKTFQRIGLCHDTFLGENNNVSHQRNAILGCGNFTGLAEHHVSGEGNYRVIPAYVSQPNFAITFHSHKIKSTSDSSY